jgi:hypothetical protein
MLDLLQAESYRLLRKKSLYRYFASFLAGYFLIAFVRAGGFSDGSIIRDATVFFSLFPAFLGGTVFSAVYTDDLNSKNLITLVGYGLGKTRIVVVKLVMATAATAAFYAFLPLFHWLTYAAFGQVGNAHQLTLVYAISLKYMLMTVAFMALSGIVVYASQRATFSIVTFIVFAFNIVSGMLSILSSVLKFDLTEHLLSGITDRILAGLIGSSSASLATSWVTSLAIPIAEFCIYIFVAIVVSAAAFSKTEMEF